MSSPGRTPHTPSYVGRRRWFASVIVLLALVLGAAVALGSRDGSSSPPAASVPPRAASAIRIYAGRGLLLEIRVPPGEAADGVALRQALTARVGDGSVATRGTARIRYVYDVEATARRALALGTDGGRVQAVRAAASSRIAAPVVRQFLRNACEAAALHVLLSTAGTRVSQQRLQAAFPRSGPLDPIGTGPGRTWGDPDRGYVGRPAGGGAAGGFGIYPGPVAATARRYGRRLDDLTGSASSRVYARLLGGRAVMAWVGLSDGPYGTWRSPDGQPVEVNFGEHTIVLTGIDRSGNLRVVNPLMGTLETWSRERFEAAWKLLGQRALAVRA